MMELSLTNLNTLLRSNYYYRTIVDKFKCFIMMKLLLTNLNILLKLNYYDETIIDKFKYFIKI
jgi:hypothetical protein